MEPTVPTWNNHAPISFNNHSSKSYKEKSKYKHSHLADRSYEVYVLDRFFKDDKSRLKSVIK